MSSAAHQRLFPLFASACPATLPLPRIRLFRTLLRLSRRSSFTLEAPFGPGGPEACLLPKESGPIGLHPLQEIREVSVGPVIVDHLNANGIEWTSLPVRIEYAGETNRPTIVRRSCPWLPLCRRWRRATRCRRILADHRINDVHVAFARRRSSTPRATRYPTPRSGSESLSPLPAVSRAAPKSPYLSREPADSSSPTRPSQPPASSTSS